MGIIVELIIGLVILGVIWQLISGSFEIILGFTFIFAMGWGLQWVLELFSISWSLWVTIPIALVIVMLFASKLPETKTAYEVLEEYFQDTQMADMNQLKLALSEENISLNNEKFVTEMNKLVSAGKVEVITPNKLWRSTRKGEFDNPIQTMEIEV